MTRPNHQGPAAHGAAPGATGDAATHIAATAALVVAVAVAAAVRVVAALGPIHDYDEGVYWQSLRQLDHGARLYGDVYSSQPPLFLLGLRPVYDLLGQGLTGGRLGVVALSVAGVAAGGLTMRRLAGPRAGAAAAFLLALDPLLVHTGSSLMADAPAVSLGLLALAAASLAQAWTPAERRTGQGPRPAWAFVAGALVAAAALTKLSAVCVAVPVVLLVVLRPEDVTGSRGPGLPAARRSVLAPLAATAGGAAAVTAAVLASLGGDMGAAVSQSIGLHISSQSLDVGGLREAVADIVRELPVAVLAVAGLVAVARRRPAVLAVLGGWLGASCAALAATHPLWTHHLATVAAPAALAGGAGCDALLARWRTAALAAVPALASVVTATATVVGAVRVSDLQAVADATVPRLQAVLPAGAVVLTDDQATAAQAELDTPPRLVDTSLVRILSGELTPADVEEDAEEDGVEGIFLGSSRLAQLTGFVDWVKAHYPRSVDVGEGTLFLRPSLPDPSAVTPLSLPDR